MSTTIDSKVVEMRFDNKQFESGVSTTMSTLDKLKRALRLDDASKGLENVSAASKKVDMSVLGNGVEAVRARFSALEVMGVTALANITNSAVNAGKSIVKSLTIDPVKTGFNEYELKMGSIQTIMAGTGESLDTVNRYLNELNKYSDDTIYSFKDMTTNIGKFTNAGVSLEDAVLAIKGISNEAAISGANANEASRAMYNFSQALSSGFVKLIDWKSIELANMATKDFKEQLIQTAVEVGTLKKGADGMYDVTKVISKANATSLNATKNFNDSLGNQWMTTEVLIGTLRKYADETTEIGAKATAAATEVKTFTMMMDTLREAAQSGWAQTWELVVGDFEEAKAFFTELSGIFGGILGRSADRRNNLLSGALSSNWDKLLDKIGEAGIELDTFKESIRDATGSDKFDEIIDEFGSLDKAVKEGAISSDILKKALDGVADSDMSNVVEGLKEIDRVLRRGTKGKDVQKLQTALKELGYELGEFGANKDGLDGNLGPVTQKAIKAFQEAQGLVVDGIAGPKTLAALEEAAGKIEKTTGEVDELKESCGSLIDVITETSGRELLLDSLMNVIKAIQRPLSAVGEAFRNTFAITPDQLYNALEGLNSFTKKLVPNSVLDAKTWSKLIDKVNELGISTAKFELKIKEVLKSHGVDIDELIEKYGSLGEAFDGGALSIEYIKEALLGFEGITESLIEGGETVDKIRRSFEGLFAIFDLISTVLAGPIKVAFKVITGVLKNLGLSILDVTAGIGDAIVRFRDNVDKVIDAISTFIVDNVSVWIEKFKETEFFKTVAGWFDEAGNTISGALDKISGKFDELKIPAFIERMKGIGQFFKDIGDVISKSKVYQTFATAITTAFGGIKNFFSNFKLPEFNLDNLKTWFTDFVKIGEKIAGVDSKGAIGAVTGYANHLKDNVIGWDWQVFKETALEKFVTFWLKSGDLVKKAFEKLKEVGNAIVKFLFGTENINLPVIMDAVTKFLWIMTLIKTIQLMDTIASPFNNLSNALENFTASLKWDAIAGALKSVAIVLGVLTVCIIALVQIPDMNKAWQAAGMLAGLLVVLGLVVVGMGLLASKINGLDMGGVLSVALSMMLYVGAVTLLIHTIQQIDNLKLNNPAETFLILAGILVTLTAGVRMISKAAGSSFRSVAAILTLMAALKMVLDIIESYDKFPWAGTSRAINKMVEMMLTLSVAIRIMSGGVKAGSSASGLALAIVAMLIGLKVMISAVREIANIPTDDLTKGIFVITILLGIMTVMMAVANLTEQGYVLEKGQKSINHYTGFALALLGVVAAIWLLGKMDTKTLYQGGLTVAGILTFFTAMLAVMGKSCSNLQTSSIYALLVMVAVLIAEMAIVIKVLEDVPWQSSLATAGAMVAMILVMSYALQSLTKYDVSSGNIYKWVGAMALLALIMAGLAGVLYHTRDMSPATALASATALSTLLGVMALSLLTLSKYDVSSGNLYKWVGAMAVMTVIVGALGAILWGMSKLETTNALENATALSLLLVALTVAMTACSLMSKTVGNNTSGFGYALIGMVGLIGIVLLLGQVLSVLKDSGIGSMLPDVLVLSAMLIALSGVMVVCAGVSGVAQTFFGGFMATMLALTCLSAIVLALGGVLALINKWDIGGMMSKVGVISAMLVVLTGVMVVCAGVSGVAQIFFGGFMATMLALTCLSAIVLALGGVLALVNKLDIGGMMSKVGVISAMLVVLTGVMVVCAAVSGVAQIFFGGFMATMLALTCLSAIVLALAGVLALIKKWDIGGMMPEVLVLSTLLLTLTSVMVVLTKVGIFAVAAIAGLIAFETFIVSLGSLLVTIGLFMSSDTMVKFLDTGILMLGKLASGLGLFMANLNPFFGGIRAVDSSIVSKVSTLSDAILTLSKAELIDGISKILGCSLPQLGTDLSDFAKNASGFFGAIGDVKPEVATAAATLAEALTALTGANLLDSIVNFVIPGDNSLGSYGKNLEQFAKSMKTVSEQFSDFSDTDVANIKRAATAAEALAELNASIPKSGGLWQSIAGSADIAEWGKKITSFADSLVAYSIKISGKNIDSEAIKRSAEAATAVSDLNNAIPKSGGLWQTIAGSQDLAVWGSKISAFATALVNYSAKVSGKNIDKDAITRSTEAASEIAKLNDAIPESDGVWQWLTGEKDLSTFGTGLSDLADGLLNYAQKASQINAIGTEPIKNTGAAIDEITKVVEKVPKIGGLFGEHDPGVFGAGIRTLAEGIRTYCAVAATIDQADIDAIGFTQNAITSLETIVANLGEIDNSKTAALSTAARNLNGFCTTINSITTAGYDFSSMSTLKTEITNFLNMVNGLSLDDVRSKFESLSKAAAWAVDCADSIASLNDKTYGGVAVLKKALDDLAGANVDGVIAAFSGKASEIKTSIGSIASGLAKGLDSAAPNMTTSAINLAGAAVSGFASKVSSAKFAGMNFGGALIGGLRTSGNSVESAGEALGKKAVEGARAKYDSMKSAGSYLVSGFAAGISENTFKAEAKAKAMAEAAEEAAREALKINSPSKVFKAIGSGIPEGFAMGIGMLGGDVKSTASDMANTAISTVSNSIRNIAALVESGIDSQPTIRPVLDLSDVRSGAATLGSMLALDSSVGVSANVSAISSMMSLRSQNGVNDDVVSELAKLRKDIGNIQNASYTINGITYDDGSNITDAVRTLIRATQIERRV